MTLRVAMPRLLPMTIVAMVALLGVKSMLLVRAVLAEVARPGVLAVAGSAVVPAAQAAPVSARNGVPVVLPSVPPKPALAVSEKKLLLDLRARRAALDARARALDERAAVLGATEQKLKTRLAQMMALQKKLEVLSAARQQRRDARWTGLVKVYEAMQPSDAAKIFDGLDMKVLLQVLARMNERKAAPVLAAMQPAKAREATDELAAMRGAAAPHG
ncbi:MAG TPA: hypothetical protein VMU82_05460 [Acetobacteraceae bacterium]|nr:hypothetical protein [Acetobacteraceae bacterium]